MANKTSKPRDPEAARQRALKQWSDPSSKLWVANRKGKLIDPPKDAAALVEKAAANGCTVAQIAHALEVSPQTLRRWREEYPEIKAAFDTGRAAEHDALVGALFNQAVNAGNKNNVTAAIFLLKARHGYVEGVPLVSNSVSVNFTLPGAMTPEQYVKTLTVEAQLLPPDQAQQIAGDRKVRKALKNELARRGEDEE